jgi:hypothetical protein
VNNLKMLVISMLVAVLVGCVAEGPVPPAPGPYWYDYYYYPSVGVYFDIYSGNYYYRSGDRWAHSPALPPTIHLDQRDRHRFESRERKPYHNDQQHRERFKPLPSYKPNQDHDRQEREYNRKSHEQYRNNPPRRQEPRK